VDSATAQQLLHTFFGALFGAGLLIAVWLAWQISTKSEPKIQKTDQHLLSPSVATVLSVLRSSAVVLNVDDEVIRASAPAYALGLVRGNKLEAHELASLVRAVRRDGQIRETELVMERSNLPTRYVTARVAPLNPRLVLALIEDRTAERRVEEIRRDFVANVSHELKTPIGAVKVLAEAVSEASEDPAAVRKFTLRMIKESDRLQRLVQQIIDLSRLQDDAPVETPREVSLDEVIETAVDTCAIDAELKNTNLVIRGDHGIFVRGNRDQLLTAISNLVANAVSYSAPDASVAVEVERMPHKVHISVIDQGIGIPPDDLDRIFERFYRVDPARHRSTGGTGLGLSIVKHVAATHGGSVKVRSVEGQGSTFRITLPLPNSDEDEAEE
jgi:two-component system, OmpR family, sensor histidine kinase SenX3